MAAVTDVVVADYFYPILNEDLVVTIEGPSRQLFCSRNPWNEFLRIARRRFGREWAAAGTRTVGDQHALGSGGLILKHTTPRNSSRWTRRTIDSESFAALSHALCSRIGRVAVRVPVTIQARGENSTETSFDLFLRKDDSGINHRTLFIRDGLVISDVRSRPVRNAAVLMIATAPALTRFLGDAENPAHTDGMKKRPISRASMYMAPPRCVSSATRPLISARCSRKNRRR